MPTRLSHWHVLRHTLTKQARGAKGLGRFLWLKAFDSARIQSVYFEGDQARKRDFEFCLAIDPVKGGESQTANGLRERSTTVELRTVLPPYTLSMPKSAAAIARQLLDHCLFYLIAPSCPTMTVHDKLCDETIDLNELLKQLRVGAESKPCKIKGRPFELQYVRLRSGERRDHSLHLCANKRPVISTQLSDHIPELRAYRLGDQGQPPAVLCVLVSSAYLDEHVNRERTNFDIPDQPTEDEEADDSTRPTIPTPLLPSEELEPDLSRKEIYAGVEPSIREYLGDELLRLREQNVHRITQYIRANTPEYRHLTQHAAERIASIPPNATGVNLNVALHKIAQELAAETTGRLRAFVENWPEGGETPELRAKYDAFLVLPAT